MYERDQALMSGPSSNGSRESAPPERFGIPHLLREPHLSLMNLPTSLPIPIEGPLVLGEQGTSNQIDDKPIQRVLDSPRRAVGYAGILIA